MKKLLLLFLLPPFIGMAQLSQTFKTHWFDGFAEINSYELTQSRYGQQRKGKAVLIFVTEDFLAKEQVKANQKSKTTIPVLKSNRSKNFLTGIYPYAIMSSSFSSLRKKHPLIKTVASIQEWCGQSYLQLNAREKENTLVSHSYFEGEASRWIRIPFVGIGFQTSTLASLVLMMYVARYLDNTMGHGKAEKSFKMMLTTPPCADSHKN